jgi:hypothetical protein
MRCHEYSTVLIRLLTTALVLVIALSTPTAAQNGEAVLHNFQLGADGGNAYGPLVADASQNLYGVTYAGGEGNCTYNGFPSGCGTVYELTRLQGGGWVENIIYAFQGGSDGAFPLSGLVFDQVGDLYGTTSAGGISSTCLSGYQGCGTVFKLTPPSQPGGVWTEAVVYQFTGGSDGSYPRSVLILDQVGNLYGTTNDGGDGYGVVFELTPLASGGNWIETTLHTFGNHRGDGAYPIAGLVLDETGNLYGTTAAGGSTHCSDGCGIVFQLQPPGSPGGSWTEKVAYAFQGGADGDSPSGDLILVRGAILGMAGAGGAYGQGNVFEIAPSSRGFSETVLYSFQGGNDSAYPFAGLTVDAAFNLYGSTEGGGGCEDNPGGCGTVFQLTAPGSPGGAWTERVLHAFPSVSHGLYPVGSLLLDEGWLFGVTAQGGRSHACDTNGIRGCGEVFAVHK